MKKFRNSVLAVFVAMGAVLLYYALPFTDVVRIVGTEVMTKGVEGETSANRVARDIRYVNAMDADEAPRVYRNVDTGWSWPPYFKFTSADLAAVAEQAASEGDQSWHRVTSYGWRLPFVSLFPNVVAIEPASGPSDSAFPWIAVIVFLFYATGIFLLWRRLFGRQDANTTPVESGAAP